MQSDIEFKVYVAKSQVVFSCLVLVVDFGFQPVEKYGAPIMPKIVLPYYYKELLVSLLERFVERLVERLFERSRISMNASLSASQSCACSSDQEYQ